MRLINHYLIIHLQQAPPVTATAAKRKKSLPEVQPLAKPYMSREEASVLSSAQRAAFRKSAEDAERYRANPLLYLTSPGVQVRPILYLFTQIN